ncbi:MAG: asparaginase domain-containing protein [Eubacterium sp.]|nr:asparaginase domain-containing protein [Eubacterium sp.]
MKILVLFTGGTIGCSSNGGVISPNEKNTKLLLELYKKEYSKTVNFEIAEPYYALSENNTGKTIENLISTVCDATGQDYNGIIVTHGTDTLQYSAAALSYALGSSTIPVLLVSSNYVLTDKKANGLSNFAAAVDFIEKEYGNGVFVPYKNSDGKVYVHRASRLLQHNDLSDDVFSIKNQYYGSYTGDIFIENPDFEEKEDEIKPFGKIKLSEFSNEIKVFNAYVGNEYPQIDESTKAVLIKTYHSGTICTDNESFKAFAEAIKNKKIPCYICGAENREIYESAKVFAEYGIIVLPPSAFVSQYMKLWIATENDVDFKEIYNQSLGGDLI